MVKLIDNAINVFIKISVLWILLRWDTILIEVGFTFQCFICISVQLGCVQCHCSDMVRCWMFCCGGPHVPSLN